MANPVITKIKEGRVECVARNVTSGVINRFRGNKEETKFLVTYRTSGEAQPDHAQMLLEGVQLFKDSDQATITSSAGIDIHMSIAGTEWGEVIIWT